MQHRKTQSLTSLRTFLDVSHLKDKPKKQLEEKQKIAQQRLNEFIETKRKFKQLTLNTHQSYHVKLEQDDEMHNVIDMLDKYQDINFQISNSDHKKAMSEVQSQIKESLEKGFYQPDSTKSARLTIKDLKTFSPHFLSSEPAGRADAINLKRWLIQYLESISRQGLDQKQKLEKASDVLFTSLNELVRQVSYECVERGQLMLAIFKSYLILFKKQNTLNHFEQKNIQIKSYKNELDLKLEFDAQSQYQEQQILNHKNTIIQLNKKVEDQNTEITQLMASVKHLSKTIDLDRTIKKQAASIITNLQREVQELRNKMNKIGTNQNNHHTHKLLSQRSVKMPSLQNVYRIDEEEADISLSQILNEVDKKTYVEVNPDIVVKDAVDEPPVITYSVGLQCEFVILADKEVQCQLFLTNATYDKIMNQQEIDNVVKEYELKEQLGLYTNQTFGIEEHKSHEGKQSLLRILDGLPGNMDQVKNMNKQDMLELFVNNIKIVKQLLDREDCFSDVEQSVLENDIDDKKSFREFARESKLELVRESRDSRPSVKFIREIEQSREQTPTRRKNNTSNLQAKFGLNRQEQIQLKTQVSMLIMLYNMQIQKTQNITKSLNDMAELLTQLFNFTRKLMIHILKSQKLTHRQMVEEFFIQFEELRKRMPVELDKEIKIEEYQEEDEEEEKEKKKQITFKKKKGRITKALQFNFQQKVNRPTMFDKLMHPGLILTAKAKDQAYLLKKQVSYWPVKNVLKTITQIYDERLRGQKDNIAIKDLEMQIFVFNNFLNRYGFKSVAEKKYLQFLLSVIHFSSIFRVNVFARIISVLSDDQVNFSVEETQFFLQGLEFMSTESALGVNVVQSESDQKFHVPYLRALDYMRVYLENKMNEEELRELRNDLENLKEIDPKNLNKAGIIDLDIFMVKVINKYRVITNRTKQFVINAFQAADLDGNKKINHNEFITLYRHIECNRFKFKEAMNIFDEQADIIENDEKNLSFNRFTSLCVNQQIFSEQSLNHFIGITHNDELEKRLLQVKQEWEQYKLQILNLLQELHPYVTNEIFLEWNKVLNTLETRILSDIYDVKPILIAHKILKLELQRLLQIGQQEDDIDELD